MRPPLGPARANNERVGTGLCEHTFAYDVEGLDHRPATAGDREAGSCWRCGAWPGSCRASLSPPPLKSRCSSWSGSRSPTRRAARRLLARLASERALPLRQLVDVAAILAELEADPAPMVAGKNLVSIIERF